MELKKNTMKIRCLFYDSFLLRVWYVVYFLLNLITIFRNKEIEIEYSAVIMFLYLQFIQTRIKKDFLENTELNFVIRLYICSRIQRISSVEELFLNFLKENIRR